MDCDDLVLFELYPLYLFWIDFLYGYSQCKSFNTLKKPWFLRNPKLNPENSLQQMTLQLLWSVY